MTSKKPTPAKESSEEKKLTPQQLGGQSHTPGAKPEWANGLRQLYDSVVEEPLPDSFKDLLAQLDKKS